MVALKILRWRLVCLSALVMLLSAGCARLGVVDNNRYFSKGAQDYPVTIVAARFAPASDVNVAALGHDVWAGSYVPVAVETKTSSRVDGALQYAGTSVLECGVRSLEAGTAFPLVFVPCAVLVAPIMAVVGAVVAAPEADVDAIEQSAQRPLQSASQGALAERGHDYLAAMAEQPVHLAPGVATTEPGAATERSDHPSHPNASGTILELGLLEVRLAGSGRLNAPLCLRMAARGRKLNAATGELIRELEHARTVECRVAANWLYDNGIPLNTAIVNGQRMLAEQLVDQLYLLYRPPSGRYGSDTKIRRVPGYVLAPLSPPAPDIYLDFRSLTKKARHVQGWGGMHFADIDNLTPTLRWEAFPRPFDPPDDVFSDITYEVRIYTGVVHQLGVAEPAALLHTQTGLVEPDYSVTTPLQPCSRYFWTVRARFRLNGVRRVTEWGGAYETAGGEVSPSHEFFYPFRTPAGVGQAACWR